MNAHMNVVNPAPIVDRLVLAALSARRALAVFGAILVVFCLGASVVLAPALGATDAPPVSNAEAADQGAGCGSSGTISREDNRRKRESSAAATAVSPAQSPHQSPITDRCTKSPRKTATGRPTA
jgi:hypothetical protein